MRRKKSLAVVMVVFLVAFLITPVRVKADTTPKEGQHPRLVDDAGLLNEAESEELLNDLDTVSADQKMDVAVVTVQTLGGKNVQAYADNFYDDNGYGVGKYDDGILLLISVSEREWAMSVYGKAIDVFSDRSLEEIGNSFSPYLSSGSYVSGFMKFASLCEQTIKEYNATHKFPFLKYFAGSIVVGIVLSVITVSCMKRQLKSVRPQRAAENYVTPDSLHVTNRREIFLYRTVDRQERPRQSESVNPDSGQDGPGSTHRSSSGRNYGGTSGRF